MNGLNEIKGSPPKIKILDVPISVVNMEECIQFVSEHFEHIRGEYICAANVHTTVMAYEDEYYRHVQKEAVLSLPDGKPLSVIGRKRGYKRMDKVTGTHFMQRIFCDKRFEDKKHYFYGAEEETLERMISKVKHNYANLKICGYEPSVFRELRENEVEELAKRINEADADFVWIGIGAPRQEILMNRLLGKVTGVMTGVGGAFNILAEKVKDAPMWMQNAGLEWLYRLYKEPKRLFKRYLITNSKFIYYVIRQKKGA